MQLCVTKILTKKTLAQKLLWRYIYIYIYICIYINNFSCYTIFLIIIFSWSIFFKSPHKLQEIFFSIFFAQETSNILKKIINTLSFHFLINIYLIMDHIECSPISSEPPRKIAKLDPQLDLQRKDGRVPTSSPKPNIVQRIKYVLAAENSRHHEKLQKKYYQFA